MVGIKASTNMESRYLFPISPQRILILFCSLLLMLLAGCEKEDPVPYIYAPPPQLGDGWNVSTLEEVGIQTSKIEEITKNIIREGYKGIHSLLIVRDGSLVFEEHFKGYDRNDLQEIFSITKSISASLVGIAIEQDLIRGTEESVLSYFPEYKIDHPNAQQLQIGHILSLTTGIGWDEKTYLYTDPRNSEYQMFQTEDWFRFVLQLPYSHQPGETYNYNTGAVHLLSAIIKKSTGQYADEFAETYLFKPLGITESHWNTDRQGYPCTGATHGGLRMKARDIAKYGQLYLDDGRWKNNQIIPEEWIRRSLEPKVDADEDLDHGFLWRIGTYNIESDQVEYFLSTGSGGQTLILIPAFDMVILFLCWDNVDEGDTLIPTILILDAIIQ